MKVLMLGWEFPPFISGGLGTACYGLTRAMSDLGAEIIFVLPRPVESRFSTHVRLIAPQAGALPTPTVSYQIEEFKHVVFKAVDAGLSPYARPGPEPTRVPVEQKGQRIVPLPAKTRPTEPPASAASENPYGGDLFAEIARYAHLVSRIALQESFDVIHAHDWMTFPAGQGAAGLTGKPLIVHVHSTEYDRSGEGVNERIVEIERAGMSSAKRVIAVSYLTQAVCCCRYYVPEEKIDVVYNAINTDALCLDPKKARITKDEKIVLFLGRITMQKGPEYFLAAAKKVLKKMDNVKFIMAGAGDMTRRTIELAAEMGIGHKVLFTGFLRGGDLSRIFQMADLYVMPSVSEPFGLAPLEALSHDVPVLISRQSGVSEVLTHALKVDFWDIDEMANKIVAVLRHPPLHRTLKEHGSFEVQKFNWHDSARNCLDVYQSAMT